MAGHKWVILWKKVNFIQAVYLRGTGEKTILWVTKQLREAMENLAFPPAIFAPQLSSLCIFEKDGFFEAIWH